MKKLMKNLKKGFTLVELVVVIAIIAILAGVVTGTYFGITNSAHKSAALQEGKQVATVIQAEVIDGEIELDGGNIKVTIGDAGIVFDDGTAAEAAIKEIVADNGYDNTNVAVVLSTNTLTGVTVTVNGYIATIDCVNFEVTVAKA